MTTTMKVIKNGIEEKRKVAYYDNDVVGGCLIEFPVPVVYDKEYYSMTFDGKYFIFGIKQKEDKQ